MNWLKRTLIGTSVLAALAIGYCHSQKIENPTTTSDYTFSEKNFPKPEHSKNYPLPSPKIKPKLSPLKKITQFNPIPFPSTLESTVEQPPSLPAEVALGCLEEYLEGTLFTDLNVGYATVILFESRPPVYVIYGRVKERNYFSSEDLVQLERQDQTYQIENYVSAAIDYLRYTNNLVLEKKIQDCIQQQGQLFYAAQINSIKFKRLEKDGKKTSKEYRDLVLEQLGFYEDSIRQFKEQDDAYNLEQVYDQFLNLFDVSYDINAELLNNEQYDPRLPSDEDEVNFFREEDRVDFLAKGLFLRDRDYSGALELLLEAMDTYGLGLGIWDNYPGENIVTLLQHLRANARFDNFPGIINSIDTAVYEYLDLHPEMDPRRDMILFIVGTGRIYN
ncbi:MAG TPA: hypothetical protein VJC39_02060 [Candidatus Nanoarchaeia archaeon]|nr:hypothetical protein [Candidatus Nanoarchaeia archaeon]